MDSNTKIGRPTLPDDQRGKIHSIRVSDQLWNAYADLCHGDGVTVSESIRRHMEMVVLESQGQETFA